MKTIFRLLLLLCPFISKAQDIIYYNAKIFTANAKQPFAEAIAIKGKYITAIGNYAEVKKKASPATQFIDLKGGFLMPGMVDSHNHGIAGGRGLIKANVDDKLLTTQEILAYANEQIAKKAGFTGDVLVIYGLNITTWSWLDEINRIFNTGIYTTQPVVLRGSDGHTGWCNKVMQQRAGLNKQFIAALNPADKIYFGTTSDGESNGFVSESGYATIAKALITETDFSLAAIKTMEYNNGLGITAWLDPAVSSLSNKRSSYLDWYQYLVKKEKLSAHVAATLVADADADPQQQINQVKAFQKTYNSRNFSIIGFKIFADGVIEHPTHTAAISMPYTGTQSKGVLMFDPKKFTRFVTMADQQGMLVHIHAIGDWAVTASLDAFEVARKLNRNFKIPHTITHLQIVQPSDFTRFAKLNVLASFQLLWAFGDVTTIDIVKPYIDSALYHWQYPVRSMLQAGATICGASDWPVSSANPFEAIYRAETRLGPMGVLDSAQCMPRMAMLYAYTSEAAKALLMEKTIGSLEVGKYADLIHVDRDILTIRPEAMRDTKVIWTMFEGKKVFTTENK